VQSAARRCTLRRESLPLLITAAWGRAAQTRAPGGGKVPAFSSYPHPHEPKEKIAWPSVAAVKRRIFPPLSSKRQKNRLPDESRGKLANNALDRRGAMPDSCCRAVWGG
jgi:hypothetical protein